MATTPSDPIAMAVSLPTPAPPKSPQLDTTANGARPESPSAETDPKTQATPERTIGLPTESLSSSDDEGCVDVSSHGTYVKVFRDGFEDLEYYRTGGYHPAHLGDCLGLDGRYQIIHKLGHGGFGTVWLCRDDEGDGFVAVKILTADASIGKPTDLSLASLDQAHPGAQYVVQPLDHFKLQGPNGTHQCVVMPVLGPACSSPSTSIWAKLGKDPGDALRRMCLQTAQALQFLHQNGICHGDFRPANILMQLNGLDSLTEVELIELLGTPREIEVFTTPSETVSPSTPRYVVPAANTSALPDQYFTDRVCVVDFSESYKMATPPKHLGIPEHYLAPEVLIDQRHPPVTAACDTWALGCTLFEIREQIPLFYMISGKDELLAEMVDFFGKLPRMWWDEWDGRAEYFTDDGKRLDVEYQDNTFESTLDHHSQLLNSNYEVERTMSVPEWERQVFGDLLRQLLRYEPSERITMDEVLQHEWFDFQKPKEQDKEHKESAEREAKVE